MGVHSNDGKCSGCRAMFEKYPNFYTPLQLWFQELQEAIPTAHISEAWRDRIGQDVLWQRRATKAKFGQSSHNWGAGIDIFCNQKGNIYPMDWFTNEIKPRVPDWIIWYGSPDAKFYELPHFEVKDWERLAKLGFLKKVEE